MSILKRILPTEYNGVAEILSSYIEFYGGMTAVAKAPYLHSSLVLLIPTFGIWSVSGWWDLPIGILPNLISFTLARYALFMGFGDEKFRRLMAGGTDGEAPMLKISATFAHFIVVQVISVILAVVAKGRPVTSVLKIIGVQSLDAGLAHHVRTVLGLGFWMISFCIFLYSICCSVATTLSVFRVTRWFNQHHS
jgi:hypothetical protein